MDSAPGQQGLTVHLACSGGATCVIPGADLRGASVLSGSVMSFIDVQGEPRSSENSRLKHGCILYYSGRWNRMVSGYRFEYGERGEEAAV